MIRFPYKFRVWQAGKILDWAEKRSKPQYPKTVISASSINLLRRKRANWRIPQRIIKRFRRLLRDMPLVRHYHKLVKGYRQTISSLQITRKYQRISSGRDYDRSRPPSGTGVDYLFFRLIELYHIEDFESLREGLIKLFPELQGDLPQQDFRAEFTQSVDKNFQSWRKLGNIVPKGKDSFLDTHRVMPELPDEIRLIVVELHQILPSFFVVTYDCILTSEATQHLLALQDQHYLGKIRFKRLIPWGIHGGGHSQGNPDTERVENVVDSLATLRGKVERCLLPYASGYFARQQVGKLPSVTTRLPAIEVFALKGVPEEATAFKQWKENARHWWESLAFNFSSDTYKNRSLVFAHPRERRSHESKTLGRTGYRFAVLWESYLAVLDTKDFQHLKEETFKKVEKDIALQEIAESLNDIIPLITLSELLQAIGSNISKFKQAAFKSIGSRRQLNEYIRLSYVVQHEAMLLARTSLEFRRNKLWMGGSSAARFIDVRASARKASTDQTIVKAQNEEKLITNPLKRIWSSIVAVKKRLTGTETTKLEKTEESQQNTDIVNLYNAQSRSIDYNLEQLDSQLQYVTTTFEKYLETRNMEVMHRLQHRVFWFTIIVTVATIIGVGATIFFGLQSLWQD